MRTFKRWASLLYTFFWLKARIKLGRHEPKYVDRSKVKMIPKPGFVYNPLLKYPRNSPCYCGSHVKAKICCLPKTKRAVPAEAASLLKEYVEQAIARAQ
jgi:uncharacterized protein YchJ